MAQKINPKQIKDQEAWIDVSFQNGWSNHSAVGPTAYAGVSYMKDSLGFVNIRGLGMGGTVAANTLIFTLPVGYRPAQHEIFVCRSQAPFNHWDVRVNTDGTVRPGDGGANAGPNFNSFSGIRFKAA